jgi:methyl coenzyme M reductase beta subunit
LHLTDLTLSDYENVEIQERESNKPGTSLCPKRKADQEMSDLAKRMKVLVEKREQVVQKDETVVAYLDLMYKLILELPEERTAYMAESMTNIAEFKKKISKK